MVPGAKRRPPGQPVLQQRQRRCPARGLGHAAVRRIADRPRGHGLGQARNGARSRCRLCRRSAGGPPPRRDTATDCEPLSTRSDRPSPDLPRSGPQPDRRTAPDRGQRGCGLRASHPRASPVAQPRRDPHVPLRPVLGRLQGLPPARAGVRVPQTPLLLPAPARDRAGPCRGRARSPESTTDTPRRDCVPAGIDGRTVVAIVPMRHTSERVPQKNYRPFAGRPLYHHIVRSLLAARSVVGRPASTPTARSSWKTPRANSRA